MLAFEVYGVPIPKGSTKAFLPKGWKRPVITADNVQTKPWQEAVKWTALSARGDQVPIEDPVVLFVMSFMPRPRSAPRRVMEPAKKPDLDKLLRSLKDGLTAAGIYRDDAQVTLAVAVKRFAGGYGDPSAPRASHVRLYRLGLPGARHA